MHDEQKFDVWKKAHNLTLTIFNGTQEPPLEVMTMLKDTVVKLACHLTQDYDKYNPMKRTGYEQAFEETCVIDYYLLLLQDLQFLSGQSYQTLQKNVAEIKQLLLPLINRDFPYQSLQ